jgi:hypothetical protein
MANKSELFDNAASYDDDPADFKQILPKKKISSIFGALVLLIGGAYFVQTTLAANISLGSGQVEFGQGVTRAVACDSDGITLRPESTFANSQGGGSFKFGSIVLSDIDSSALGCRGKSFTLRAFGISSSTPINLVSSVSSIVVRVSSGSPRFTIPATSGVSLTNVTNTGFTITLDPAATPAAAADVSRITIESAEAATYVVGETGPGGGIIFYYAEAGFSCGPTRSLTCKYLEAAPSGWNGGGSDPTRRWANVTYEMTTVNNASSPQTATATAIGWGYRNTRAIILQGNTDAGTIAAALADSHSVTVGGVVVDDWYLPSNDELTAIYDNGAIVGGLFQGFDWYWSSTEASGGSALMQMMDRFNAGGDDKSSPRLVRPIRAF